MPVHREDSILALLRTTGPHGTQVLRMHQLDIDPNWRSRDRDAEKGKSHRVGFLDLHGEVECHEFHDWLQPVESSSHSESGKSSLHESKGSHLKSGIQKQGVDNQLFIQKELADCKSTVAPQRDNVTHSLQFPSLQALQQGIEWKGDKVPP
jgi:hypothetical protein